MALIYGLLVALITVSNRGSTDTSKLLANYSKACQLTHDKCTNVNINDCQRLEGDKMDTPAYWCYVLWGFCTDKEFEDFTSSLCGGNTTDWTSGKISDAKLHFYEAIEKVSNKCGLILAQYVSQTLVLLLMKTEENYCSLMTANLYGDGIEFFVISEGSGCSYDELERLQQAACGSEEKYVNQNLSNAILRASPTCQDEISNCFDNGPWTVRSLITQQYCDILDSRVDNASIITCLEQDGYCSEAEIDMLRLASCLKIMSTSETSDLTDIMSNGFTNVTSSVITSRAGSDFPTITLDTTTATSMPDRLTNAALSIVPTKSSHTLLDTAIFDLTTPNTNITVMFNLTTTSTSMLYTANTPNNSASRCVDNVIGGHSEVAIESRYKTIDQQGRGIRGLELCIVY
ncbi:hypothetical protein Btru_032381 [Bulinus truncatus]|nr:hypothetical protein Btru_032381 [Bulinus truncatus]